MSKSEKTLQKMRSRPFKKDITFGEADSLLGQYGFVCRKKSGSSHQVYRHPKYPGHISIPVAEYIKPYTVEDICEAIKYLEENKNV